MAEVKQPEKKITGEERNGFADRYENSIGVTTRFVAKRLIAESPPFSNDSVVLDDACGTGIVTEEIQEHLRSQPDVKIKVYAADSAAQMIQVFDTKLKKAKDNGTWPNIAEVHTHVVRAEELDESFVPSNTVTHAYMNFGIFFCSDPVKAAGQIYRSLAPGGKVFITTWADLGYEDTIRETEKACNPNGKPFVLPFAEEWKDIGYMSSVMREAGFNGDKIVCFQQPSFFRAKTVADMAEMHQQVVSQLLRGPNGFSNAEEKEEWKRTLIEKTINNEHFYEEADCVKMKMLANVVVCTK